MKIMDEMTLDLSEVSIECMPFFLGQRGDKDENAYFRNLTEANFTPRNMVKALVQGIEQKYEKKLAILNQSEESCLGAVINAGKGIGLYSTYGDGAREIMRYEETIG